MRPWTAARKQRFAHLWTAGVPTSEIGHEFHLSHSGTVYTATHLFGLEERKFRPTTTPDEFARLLQAAGGYRDITRADMARLPPLPLGVSTPTHPATYVVR